MTLISLDNLTPVASTAPKSTGGRPFPCHGQGWTKHTATVVGASIKSFDSGDSLSIRVENGEHAAELLINLDPSGAPDPQKALETRNLAITILGALTNGKLDSAKVEKARGQVVQFIAKHKGFSHKDGRSYHKVSTILTGQVDAMTPVTGHEVMPLLPGQAALPQASGSDVIPF